MLKTGDKAILQISFELVERGGDYTFDDHADVERHVRGDVVEILRMVDNKTDKRKHDKLVVIYNPKTFASTTVSVEHLKPVKNTINIDVPVGVSIDAKKIADALTDLNKAIKEGVKVSVGDTVSASQIKGGTIKGNVLKDTSLHVGGMIRANNKISF
ncbi:hypothetical protein P4305_18720 [Bacillus thuringiensis]|nr:hypothetical protein [Bacillus thuringiensis]